MLPNDTIQVTKAIHSVPSDSMLNIERPNHKSSFKIPKMPLVSSDVFKKRKSITEDVAVNTTCDNDIASEITKHVATLKKISLIAEEFNQKTGTHNDIVKLFNLMFYMILYFINRYFN